MRRAGLPPVPHCDCIGSLSRAPCSPLLTAALLALACHWSQSLSLASRCRRRALSDRRDYFWESNLLPNNNNTPTILALLLTRIAFPAKFCCNKSFRRRGEARSGSNGGGGKRGRGRRGESQSEVSTGVGQWMPRCPRPQVSFLETHASGVARITQSASASRSTPALTPSHPKLQQRQRRG